MNRRPPSFILIIGLIVAVVLLAGLNRLMSPAEPGHEHDHGEEEAAQHADQKTPPPPPPPIPASKELKRTMVEVVTDKGTFRIKLYDTEMPVTVKNFRGLVENKFYDGLTFHRVEDWVVQGGDPTGTGTGSSKSKIKLEINQKMPWSKEGQVGMARSQDPNSASCQWFVITKAAPWLNPSPQAEGYALFGEVTEGMDVVKKLQRGDKMKSVKITGTVTEKPQEMPGPPG